MYKQKTDLKTSNKREELSEKLWQVIMLLPTNSVYYKFVQTKHLCSMADRFKDTDESPYMLLYDLQIVEILHRNNKQKEWPDQWPDHVYRLVQVLVKNLKLSPSNTLLNCLLITLRLVFSFLCVNDCEAVVVDDCEYDNFEETLVDEDTSDLDETPRKKAKRSSNNGDKDNSDFKSEGTKNIKYYFERFL